MKTKLLLLLIVSVLVGSGSCKKDKDNDPDVCATNWATSTQDELTAVVNATLAYSNNPTVTNCNAYKNAYQKYLNALKAYDNCTTFTGMTKAEWQQAISEAQSNLNSITCQ